MQKCITPSTISTQEQTFAGELECKLMPDLQASLAKPGGVAPYSIVSGMDSEGIPYIEGDVSASVSLICERCLGMMDYELRSHFLLTPVKNDEETKELPARYEPVLVNKEDKISIADLLEQELILQLPLVPKHEETSCNTKVQQEVTESKRPNPFSALVSLKQKR